jgi:hypothetical protein
MVSAKTRLGRDVLEYVKAHPDITTINTISQKVGVGWRTARKYLNQYRASQGLPPIGLAKRPPVPTRRPESMPEGTPTEATRAGTVSNGMPESTTEAAPASMPKDTPRKGKRWEVEFPPEPQPKPTRKPRTRRTRPAPKTVIESHEWWFS